MPRQAATQPRTRLSPIASISPRSWLRNCALPQMKLKTARDMKPSKPKLPRRRSAPSVLLRWRGSFIGSVSGSGLVRLIYPPVPPPAPTSSTENPISAMREVKLELAQLAALKSSLDIAARNTTNQYAKIADRLDRIDQRSAAAAETTASLPAASLAAPPPTQTAALATVAPPAEPAKLSDRILPDWVVHDVQNGHALVESRYGGFFAVSTGSVLPGIGRVDMIKRPA